MGGVVIYEPVNKKYLQTSNLSYVWPLLDLPASSKILVFTDLSLEGGSEGSMPCTSLEWGIYEASGFCR